MLPGPTQILKAPGCQKPVKISTILSGNTCGAVFWTDGKQEAPMLPDNPWLRKSPSEGVLFWTDECEEVGQINLWGDDEEKPNPEWEGLEFAEDPIEADYISAIENGLGDTEEKIRYLRIRLWWAGNDPIRKGEAENLNETHLANLRELEKLLSEEDPNNRLMRAEVCRELGKFDESTRLLEYPFPEEYAWALEKIRSLCGEELRAVARLGE